MFWIHISNNRNIVVVYFTVAIEVLILWKSRICMLSGWKVVGGESMHDGQPATKIGHSLFG